MGRKPKYIVSDWHGTIYQDKDENDFLWFFLDNVDFSQFLLKQPHISKVTGQPYAEIKNYIITVQNCLRGFQDKSQEDYYVLCGEVNKVVKHLRLRELNRLWFEYAKNNGNKVDKELLEALYDIKGALGELFILSGGYNSGIKQILMAVGKRYNAMFKKNNIWANELWSKDDEFDIDDEKCEKEHIIDGFTLANLDQKVDYLRHILLRDRYKNIPPRKLSKESQGVLNQRLGETMYLGDSPKDEACLDLVHEGGGWPVVSKWATPEFKQKCAKKYGDSAIVMERGRDVLRGFDMAS